MAENPPAVLMTAEESRQHLIGQALRDVLATGLLAGSVGVGARTLASAPYLFGRRRNEADMRPAVPSVVPLPQPVFASEQDKKRALLAGKAAAAAEKAAEEEPGFFSRILSGHYAQEKGDLPYYGGALVGTSLVGLGAGYGVANHLINRKRKADLDQEVEDAKTRFRQALVSNYNPAQIPVKTAADDPLDRLALMLGISDDMPHEKAAAIGQHLGQALGMYGMLAAPLALGSGYLAYRYTADRSTSKLLRDAIERRERDRLAKRPPDVTIVPDPVTLAGGRLRESNPAAETEAMERALTA